MKHKHGWDLETVEAMYPFEFEIYVTLLNDWLETERKLAEEAAQRR